MTHSFLPLPHSTRFTAGTANGRTWSTALCAGLVLVLVGCAPRLDSIEPGSGYNRQLLAVDGSTLFASVVWDVGLPTETSTYNGLFGTSYFQIPAAATPGTHPVALRNSYGTSISIDVMVLAPSGNFPSPRIVDVGVLAMSGTGPVDVAVAITGANLDVDATVTVNGTAPTLTVRWGGLPIDYLQNHVPATYGYPIYHYVQLVSVVEDVPLGSILAITVTNTDGLADTGSYTLPAAVADLDSDGDGLLDSWEDGSYTAPSAGTVALNAMGADKRRKNIFVEVDWIAAAAPNATIWATIEAVFNDAPVLNPDGSRGVSIIIDRGQGGAFTAGGTVLADHTTMDFGPNAAAGYTDFFTYKTNNFNNDRLNVFHYGIFGRARPGGSSGRGEVWGNDFMVTFVNFGQWAQALAQVGTFVHELGHNLGLTHGDLNTTPAQWNEAFKPNFPTTMNYRWQFPGISVDCDWTSEGIHTYSQGMFAQINEVNVNENIGICDNQPLDMNGDGLITVGQMDVGLDGDNTDTHDDFDQWYNLLLDFRAAGSRWNGN